MIGTVILTGLLLLIFYIAQKALKLVLQLKKYSHIPGPEPIGLKGVILGNLTNIIAEDRKGVFMSLYLANLYVFSNFFFLLLFYLSIYLIESVNEYGNTFKFRLFDQVAIFTIDPKIVKVTYILYLKHVKFYIMDPLFF